MLSLLSVGYGGVSHMGVMCPGDGWLIVLYRLVGCRKLVGLSYFIMLLLCVAADSWVCLV